MKKCVEEECENDAQEGSKHCRECWTEFANESRASAHTLLARTLPDNQYVIIGLLVVLVVALAIVNIWM